MQNRIYRVLRGIRKHATTIAIALVVSSLSGAGGAYAASQISFSQIKGKVAGSQIHEGVVDYENLTFPLRRFIDNCREDCASNTALNHLQIQWGEDIARAKAAILAEVETNYVHK
jgi:hypothetical protein